MSAYLVEWSVQGADNGEAIDEIVGPFATSEEALLFAEELDMGHSAEGGYGGYSGVELVCDGNAKSPEAYRAEWEELNAYDHG